MPYISKRGLFLQIDNLDVQIAYPDLVKNDGELNKRVDGVSVKFSLKLKLKLIIHEATVMDLKNMLHLCLLDLDMPHLFD